MGMRSSSFAAGSKYYGVALEVADGGAIDTALNALIAQIRGTASLERGRMTCITIPEGSYTMSSTTSTITLEPWVRIRTSGNVRIVATGHSVPVFWLRNDVSPQFSQGSESENNNAKVIDASNGVLLVEGNLSAGSALIRLGNGDGVWGTDYAGTTAYFVAMAEFCNLFGTGLDNGIQLTNNGCFSTRWEGIRLTTCNKNIVTSSSTVGKNSFEQHCFINCFFNNTNTCHIEFNGGGGLGFSGHQLSFVHSSLTFCAGDVVVINSASTHRFEMTQGRLENFLKIASSPVASPNTMIALNNTMIIPTNAFGGPNLVPHLRILFTGTYQLQLLAPKWVLMGANTWQNVSYNDAGTQFLCDDTVFFQGGGNTVSYSSGTNLTNGNMRCWPIPKASWALNRNSTFEEASLNGWTTGGTATITRTTTANQFYSGTAGLSVVCASQYGIITSSNIPVRAGTNYYADLVARYSDASVTTTAIVTPTITWYAADGTTSLGTSVYTQSTTYQNWYTRRSATQFVRHPTGIMAEAPAGAAFATITWNFSGSGSITANCTASWFVDNAVFVEV